MRVDKEAQRNALKIYGVGRQLLAGIKAFHGVASVMYEDGWRAK